MTGGAIHVEREGTTYRFCCSGCSLTHAIVGARGEEGTAALMLIRLGVAAFLSMNIMALSWATYDRGWATLGMEYEALPYLEALMFVLAAPVMLFIGYPFARNAVYEARTRRLSIDSLIALGTASAFGFSTYQIFSGGRGVYFDTTAMTLTLVTAGRYLESMAKVRTTSAIARLIELQPETARVIQGDNEKVVPSADVRVGDRIKVLPGERFPLDGVILEGTTTANEATLTGESAPVVKQPGDRVYAATMNLDGAVLVRVAAESTDTVHAHVVRLMEEAQQSRSTMQVFVDRLATMFIPMVIGIAGLTLMGWLFVAPPAVAVLHALSVLVVACPCALGIGTPIASVLALGKAAERGVLVRSTGALERLAEVHRVVFDKTGTLTHGSVAIDAVHTSLPTNTLMSIVASLEAETRHPLAVAVERYARENALSLLPTRNGKTFAGMGIEGEVQMNGEWKHVLVGSRRFMKERGVAVEHPAGGDSTTFYVAWDGVLRGTVQVRDTIRDDARAVVEQLSARGIRTAMLSGDSDEAARNAANKLGIDAVHSRMLPADKVRILQTYRQSETVAMVGDGINDAPSLSAADVGITLASASDIAKESADVVVVGDHLEHIPWLIDVAQRTFRTIRWNLFWAFGYNAVGIALAVVGLLDPIVAAVVMVLSSAFIVANSARSFRHSRS
jgi:heavy metal translocating P-type ATPase